MNGNGERPGTDPNSAEAALGSTLPGIRRIGTYTPIVRHEIRHGERGGMGTAQVRRLEFRAATRIGPENFHEEVSVFDGLNPVEIPGENGGIE